MFVCIEFEHYILYDFILFFNDFKAFNSLQPARILFCSRKLKAVSKAFWKKKIVVETF